jgi:hypothetical protein
LYLRSRQRRTVSLVAAQERVRSKIMEVTRYL